MDPFDFTHSNAINLPHLSASTINSFIENRFSFYQSKVLGKPFQGNEYTARGTAVEHGVNVWLEKPEETDFLKHTLAKFDEEIQRAGISKIAAEEVRDSLDGLLSVALKFYKNEFSERKARTQHKIECQLPGVGRNIIGYLDFFQQGHAVRDSKVVSKTPSKLKQSYVLQGSLYRAAMKVPVYFDFFVANKTPVHKPMILTDNEYAFGLSYLTVAAKVVEELEECSDPKRVMELMSFPNLDSFYSEKDKKEAAKAWGIDL
jgi:hypothetical protein